MFKLIGALFLGLTLTSCMDLDMQFKVGSKGNGELEMRLRMLEQMYHMMRQPQEQQNGIQSSLFDEAKLAALAQDHGGKLWRYRNDIKDGFRNIEVYVVFPDAKALIEATSEGQISLTKSDDVWTWSWMDHEAMVAFDKMDNALVNQQIEMLRPSLNGMKVRLEVIAPKIVDSNMARSGNGVRFDFDFERDIGQNGGNQAANAFKQLLQRKWVRYRQ